MLNPVLEKRYQKQLAAIEASFRVEGMDPSEDPVYQSAKAKVLAGEMTPKQALTYVIEQSALQRASLAATA
jgi:hypothetical protein